MKKFDPIQLLSKAMPLGPSGKKTVPTVWPDGANTVRIYVTQEFKGMKAGNFYIMERVAFESKDQVNYFVPGTKEKVSQHYMKQMLGRGKFSVAI